MSLEQGEQNLVQLLIQDDELWDLHIDIVQLLDWPREGLDPCRDAVLRLHDCASGDAVSCFLALVDGFNAALEIEDEVDVPLDQVFLELALVLQLQLRLDGKSWLRTTLRALLVIQFVYGLVLVVFVPVLLDKGRVQFCFLSQLLEVCHLDRGLDFLGLRRRFAAQGGQLVGLEAEFPILDFSPGVG